MSPALPTTSKMFSILFVSCLETQLIEMLTLPSCGLTLIFIVEVCDCVGWLACILLLLQWRGWGETSYCWDSLRLTHCLSNTRFTRNSANFKSSDRVQFNHKIFPRVLSDSEFTEILPSWDKLQHDKITISFLFTQVGDWRGYQSWRPRGITFQICMIL